MTECKENSNAADAVGDAARSYFVPVSTYPASEVSQS